MRAYKIVVLPGDGVGREVVPETVKVLEAARDAVTGFDYDFEEYPCGGKYYLESGKEWPDEAWEGLQE